MHKLILRGGALALALTLPAGASGAVEHTVAPGETLWSIASASNLTTRTVAAFNGVPEDAPLVAGQSILVPTEAEGASALADPAAPATGTGTGAPAPMGGYVVQPGDTLSGLAARTGASVEQLAWMNGLSPAGVLIAGTGLKLPTGSGLGSAAATVQAPAAPAAGPQPTPGTLSSGEVSSLAAEQGVSGSLASAIAWQESGFNNAMVSSAGARGVMQVMPGTWDWVDENLAGGTLDPASSYDNVRAGSLYLAHLLSATGGDVPTAVAAYYQGLSSVQRIGMLPETRQYVDNVLALQGRF